MRGKPSILACCCGLLAGALALSVFDELPHWTIFLASGSASFAALVFAPIRVPACVVAGLSLTGLAAHEAIGDRLSADLQGIDIRLFARVEGFPREGDGTLRLTVVPVGRPELPGRIRLTWLAPSDQPRAGELWGLGVRLRRPGGYANPHGFDFEKWLFRERIGATGYVIADAHNYRVRGESSGRRDRLRKQVVRRIGEALPGHDAAPVLMAIAVGARHGIARDQWDLFARTGTSHLMAISGLHVGLAMISAYGLLRILLACVVTRRNLRSPALVGAALLASGYAWVSGFALPAQRALVMILVAVVLVLLRRRVRPSIALAVAFLIVFLADPLSTLSPGFRLSFAAVAILLLSLKTVVESGRCLNGHPVNRALAGGKRLVRLQVALLIGLFPLTVIEFGRISLVAPVVNLVVLPVFNLLTVPAALLGMLLDGPFDAAGKQLFRLAAWSAQGVMAFLRQVDALEGIAFETASPIPWLVLALASLHVLCPPGWPGRRIGFACLAYVLTFRPAPPPDGCVDLHVLDVGQGLSAVARTRTETVLYDTGPSFRGGGGTTELVVLPFLQHLGIRSLDHVIISHDDLDHSGGIRTLLAAMPVGEVIAGPASLVDVSDTRCTTGLAWHADGVAFRILHPGPDSRWTGNNASCVLTIGSGELAILLPGDIEKPVETLLDYQGLLPKSEVVIVPHHGSRTSSSEPLVAATRPSIVIIPAAWRNRWGFPKADIVGRWREAGALVLNTATDGAVSLRLCPAGIRSLERSRARFRSYWHERRRP